MKVFTDEELAELGQRKAESLIRLCQNWNCPWGYAALLAVQLESDEFLRLAQDRWPNRGWYAPAMSVRVKKFSKEEAIAIIALDFFKPYYDSMAELGCPKPNYFK